MTSVSCPICGKPLPSGADPSAAPFCSVRCRQIDLGRWLGERYRIAPRVSSPDSEEPIETHPVSCTSEEPKVGKR
ncbi:MAG: DNA gyrase inhibitor YacG [Planctomycetes bacterium]|nr:DNA gyrase inhibitor YacG [Planctomycetota bacterium]